MSSQKEKGVLKALKARGRKMEKHETVTLRLLRSGIGTPEDQRSTLRGLGFRKVGQVLVREDTPAIRGMIHKVRHLLEVVKD